MADSSDGDVILNQPNRDPESTAAATTHFGSHPTAHVQIGPYRLLKPIGEGGMGTVWMAEQEKPVRRRVALKFVKAGSVRTKSCRGLMRNGRPLR